MQSSYQNQLDLPIIWQKVMDEYQIIQVLGTGAFGQVVQAQSKTTGEIVAIKLIQNVFSDIYQCKKVLREIQIMRQLTKMKENIFTTKLVDIITPTSNKKEKYSDLFIIMNSEQQDLKKIFTELRPPAFSEQHIVTILYNLLCSVNFLHSANIMHRDLKPANILINSECGIKICDFGLARSLNENQLKQMDKYRGGQPSTAAAMAQDMDTPVGSESTACQSPWGAADDGAFNSAAYSAAQKMMKTQQFAQDATQNASCQTQRFSRKDAHERMHVAMNLQATRDERRERPRQLSIHVVSRWYRAPEAIFGEQDYDTQLDNWSVGCILGEMIKFSSIYDTQNQDFDRRFLFAGTSCFPLSPCKDMQQSQQEGVNIISKNDQMIKIIRKLGRLSPSDMSFITDGAALEYCQSLQPAEPKDGLADLARNCSQDLTEILKSLLEFNPFFRTSAKECLKSPIFDEIRVPTLEEDAPFKIFLDIDKEGAFDYESAEQQTLSMETLRKKINKEIHKVKKMN